MLSTVEDLARLHLALVGNELLSAETDAQMTEPQVETIGRNRDGQPTCMALGWFTAQDSQGRRWVWHSGGSIGGRTLLLRLPDEGSAVVVLTNCSNSDHLRAIADELYELAESLAASPVE